MANENQSSLSATVLAGFIDKVVLTADNVYVGIDPGADGAIGYVCGKHYAVVDIPTYKVDVKRTRKMTEKEKAKVRKATGVTPTTKTHTVAGTTTKFRHRDIVELFRLLTSRLAADEIFVHVEIQQPQVKGKGATISNAARTMSAYAMWPLFLAAFDVHVTESAPTTWKSPRRMDLYGKDKEFARQRALALFPLADIGNKKDHNRAEALLLAEDLRRVREGRATH